MIESCADKSSCRSLLLSLSTKVHHCLVKILNWRRHCDYVGSFGIFWISFTFTSILLYTHTAAFQSAFLLVNICIKTFLPRWKKIRSKHKIPSDAWTVHTGHFWSESFRTSSLVQSLYSLDNCHCRKQKGLCLRSKEEARRGVAVQSVSTGVTAI